MPSIFGHAVAALTIADLGLKRPQALQTWALAALSGAIPDIDSLGLRLGIPYGHMLGHRGVTHSIAFATIWAAVLIALFFRQSPMRLRYFAVLFAATVSHGILDAMTDGGLGVGFFIPFDNGRYFFPVRPIAVSPLSIGRVFDQARTLMTNEILWIGLPCLVLWVASRLARWRT